MGKTRRSVPHFYNLVWRITLSNWIHFAAKSRADTCRTFALAKDRKLIVRNALNVNGNLIAKVRSLQVCDRILLSYPGPAAKIELAATIAQPKMPHETAPAIDRIGPERSRRIARNDVPLLDGDFLEVVRLTNAESVTTQLRHATSPCRRFIRRAEWVSKTRSESVLTCESNGILL